MAAGDGLVTMTPTSIVVAGAGSSASIQSDGSVDFSTATGLSLNGVFTSSFDNYLIVIRNDTTSDASLDMKLRVGGTDTTDSNYARQFLQVNGSGSALGGRVTGQSSVASVAVGTEWSGYHIHIYGPALAQATAGRSVSGAPRSEVQILEFAWTHSTATAYDGFTFTTAASQTMTGNIVVFGYEE